MTQQEYEERIGEKVSAEEFETANSIYMNSSLDKDEFCEAYKHINPSTFKLVKDLSESVDHFQQSRNSLLQTATAVAEVIAEAANEGEDAVLRNQARRLIGVENYAKLCLKKGYNLDKREKDYLLDLIEHQSR